MTCIHSQHPLLLTVVSHLKQPKAAAIFHNQVHFQNKRHNAVSPLKTKALASYLLLGVESSVAPNSGNVQELLRTTTGLLFVYWIANFVVPELIVKDLQSDKTDEDQETKQEDTTE